ncbi:MAG TPA: LysM domain-containing protein [Acidiferrobacterales bacterium]|nr:LysM domain-containing protein [Acidiferrobacterales bacterium]
MPVKNLLSIGAVLALFAFTAPAFADTVALKSDHPDRYVVQKGDTLWDISKRFLKDPWRWASVWTINEQIKNPHLIYPGDVILLTYVDGKPQLSVQREEKLAPAPEAVVEEVEIAPTTAIEEPAGETPSGMKVVKLHPKAHVESISAAIPTISPDAIVPFLTEPLVVGRSELDRAGYVTIGLDDRVALGDGSQFYARGLKKNNSTEYYQIFRQGAALKHPDTGETLAYEAQYLGDARVLEAGDPAKLVVTRVKQEILPTDRLLAAPDKAALPYYFPRAPEKNVKGRILAAVNGLREFGPTTIVAISLGKREGMEEGHVLRILRHVGVSKDPVTKRMYKMPDEETGLLMVFRVFDKVSYALIMDANRPVHIYDALRTP